MEFGFKALYMDYVEKIQTGVQTVCKASYDEILGQRCLRHAVMRMNDWA
jgi:hypothetical protein